MVSTNENNVARALLSGAYDVYNKFYGDVQIDKSKTHEIKLAKKNIEECLKINEKHAKFVMRLSINDYVGERK